jgi:integrase/recombinase XerC/integrase/recombinase XerD
VTLQDSLDLFLVEQELRGNTPKTIYNYTLMVGLFFTYLETQKIFVMLDVSVIAVKSYQLYLLRKKNNNDVSKNLSLHSVRTYLRHVKVFLLFCYQNSLLEKDVSLEIHLPKASRPLIEILSDEEIQTLIDCFSEDTEICLRNKCIIYLMLDCGLRLSEAALLRFADLHINEHYALVFGKGRKERIVPLGAQVCAVLTEYLGKRYATNLEALFLTEDHLPLTRGVVTCLCFRLKKKSGIKRLHPHLLRHTFATNFLIAGLGDIYELSRILGHSAVAITERYLHIASYYMILRKRGVKSYIDTLSEKSP